ncbi:MAG TPA: HEPN domain-containing protein [Candidatus Avalokitesvara rifleensis]|uniref:HEPN domain-containing protein n=1 Tax=Candidatus Avalokitesvara rifleensis TaxID=3367620 RepID=UPI00271388EC|nr:HEPN domain-containing protein [Candidatus Brocadiales bacterium]
MTSEIDKLIEKGKRSLALSKDICQRGDYDFAVSRAYYAMFYVTEALLLTKGLSFSSHSAVIAAFGQYFVKPGILPSHLHQYLRDAFEKRSIGDYCSDIAITKEEAEIVLEQADKFIEKIIKHLKSNTAK